MSYYPEPDIYRRKKITVRIYFYYYATKIGLKGPTDIDTSGFAKKTGLNLLTTDPRISNPTTHRPAMTYPATNRLTELIIIFKRLDNRKMFFLQNTNTKKKT